MFGMDAWDGVILTIAAYVAVMSLVRLMAVRKRKLVEELQGDAERRTKADRLHRKGQEIRDDKAA